MSPPLPPCDLLLFCAISAELAALKAVAQELQLPFQRAPAPNRNYYDLGLVGTNRVGVVRTEMGPLSFRGSAAQAIQYMRLTQATGLIGVGMAFGVDPKVQNIGDVLIATGVLPYDIRTVRDRKCWGRAVDYSNVDRFAAKPSLVAIFRAAAALPEWQNRTHAGLLLSGGARIHSKSYREELRRKCGTGKGEEVVGGDMESVGFLSASEKNDGKWITIKGISDYADRNRDEAIGETRPLACYNAAKFVLSAIRGQAATNV